LSAFSFKLSSEEHRTIPTGNHNFGFSRICSLWLSGIKTCHFMQPNILVFGTVFTKDHQKRKSANSYIPTKHCDLRSVTRALVNHIFEGEHIFTVTLVCHGGCSRKIYLLLTYFFPLQNRYEGENNYAIFVPRYARTHPQFEPIYRYPSLPHLDTS
jgi:hypothetical protein